LVNIAPQLVVGEKPRIEAIRLHAREVAARRGTNHSAIVWPSAPVSGRR
jgi:hypothetical protein